MRKQPLESRGRAQGGSQGDSLAPAVSAPRPSPARSVIPGFAFLTAEGGQRYRLDELFREVGRRSRVSVRLTPYAWGFGGFLIGAIIWHFVGVWGLLSGVVVKEPDAAVSVIARPAEVVAGLPNCTVLVLNRLTGRTTSVPCPEPMPAFDEARDGLQEFASARVR